ncbi:MAG: hypothetical protein GX075_08365 [Firmicutes bacterium]|nr:hypothetical protein [Bacillota bacterium]
MGINNLYISEKSKAALTEIQKRLIAEFDVDELVVFGAGVKEAAVDDSDPDLLVITKEELSYSQKKMIKEFVDGINSEYGANYRLMVFDRNTWEVWAGQSLYQEVTRDGVSIW